jgi:hypothetical protein
VRHARVPIGHPIANTRVYVLDEMLLPLPTGAVGELCIAGLPVAAGYLAAPELSAARFVREPDWTGFHDKMFRSGDLGRQRATGEFELIGRQDHQVKIRGFRFDLTEVEAVLSTHASVVKCAAQIWGEGENAILMAYCVADAPIPSQEFRAFAGRFLPEYMIPSEFVAIAKMPLTAHGKIDRKALPRPSGASALSGLAAEIRERRLPLEEALRLVFAAVLRLRLVELDDDLMELGSNSLNLIRIQRALRQVLGRSIPVTDLFAYPTARRLARHLDGVETASIPVTYSQSRAARQREVMFRSRQRRVAQASG